MRDGPDIHIDALSFQGFDQDFADRATHALEQGLRAGAGGLPALESSNLAQLDPQGLDFASAERLGATLATAILQGLAR